MKVKKEKDIQFTRTLHTYKLVDGVKVPDTHFIAQPYIVGVYICIEPGTIQLTLEWKEYEKWVKGSIKKMKKNGLEVEIFQQSLTNFLTIEEINNYVLKQ